MTEHPELQNDSITGANEKTKKKINLRNQIWKNKKLPQSKFPAIGLRQFLLVQLPGKGDTISLRTLLL